MVYCYSLSPHNFAPFSLFIVHMILLHFPLDFASFSLFIVHLTLLHFLFWLLLSFLSLSSHMVCLIHMVERFEKLLCGYGAISYERSHQGVMFNGHVIQPWPSRLWHGNEVFSHNPELELKAKLKGKEICYSLPTNLVKVLILQLVGMLFVSYFF